MIRSFQKFGWKRAYMKLGEPRNGHARQADIEFIMAFLNLLTGALALSGPVSARIFHSSISHAHVHKRHENLVSMPQVADLTTAPTIKADVPNEIL